MDAIQFARLQESGAQGPGTVTPPAMEIDWGKGGVFRKTIAAGAQVFTFANVPDAGVIIVVVTGQTSTLTWPTVLWAGGVAPTQTTAGTDVYTFVRAGANIFGSVVQAMA